MSPARSFTLKVEWSAPHPSIKAAGIIGPAARIDARPILKTAGFGKWRSIEKAGMGAQLEP
jgi:hypothetical protein